MAAKPAPLLLVPGIGNSGPTHWQSLWQATLPNARRVEQADWDAPRRSAWCNAIEREVQACLDKPVLVAHSLGCLAVVFWANDTALSVAGALLVAPPDPEGPNFPPQAAGFDVLPFNALPFPSIVVASSNDLYASLPFAARCAAAWRSKLCSVGEQGHINADSGLGEWAEGLALLDELRV